MGKGDNLESVGTKLVREAELGLPAELKNVNKELQDIMRTTSAADYKTILDVMNRVNVKDLSENLTLPPIDLYDSSGKGGVADAVKAHLSNGSIVTGEDQPKVTAIAKGMAGESVTARTGSVEGALLSLPTSERIPQNITLPDGPNFNSNPPESTRNLRPGMAG